MLIETARRHAAKITNARERCLDKALEKFIHALTAQGHLRANRLVFSQFEIGNAFLGQRFHRALAGDQGKLRLGLLQRLLHVRLRADRGVNYYFLDLWNLVDVLIAVQLLHRRHDPFFVIAIKFVFHFSTSCPSSSFSLVWLSVRCLSPAFRRVRSISHWKYESGLRVPRSCRWDCPAISGDVS